jgi:hypothetical protein
LAALSFTIGGLCGVGAGAWRWRNPYLDYYPDVRGAYVLNQIRDSGPVDTLILGDSILESTLLDDVCGKTFNASVGAAQEPKAAEIAAVALPRLKPKTIVVEIGTNTIANGEEQLFYRRYPALLRQLAGRRLILVGTPRSATVTAYIERTAQEIGAAFIPPVTGNLTKEGVHPTPEGSEVYRRLIAEACS